MHPFLFPGFVRREEPIAIDHPPFVSSRASRADPWGRTSTSGAVAVAYQPWVLSMAMGMEPLSR